MSDLIVSKPFLRGNKRFRRNDPAPTDLDKPTLAEYLRLGMLAPSENKPAAPARQPGRAEPKRRETPGPRTTKPAGAVAGGAAGDAALPGGQPLVGNAVDGSAAAADSALPGEQPPADSAVDGSGASGAGAADTPDKG